MRTIPRSIFKSSTKDLSSPIFELVIQPSLDAPFDGRPEPWLCYDLGRIAAPMLIHDNTKGSNVIRFSSMDSGLEAFSRNPTHGSFSALTFQSTEFANYANQRFLSY